MSKSNRNSEISSKSSELNNRGKSLKQVVGPTVPAGDGLVGARWRRRGARSAEVAACPRARPPAPPDDSRLPPPKGTIHNDEAAVSGRVTWTRSSTVSASSTSSDQVFLPSCARLVCAHAGRTYAALWK